MSNDQANVTVLLHAWGTGDRAALDQLTPRVYVELHRLARNCMRKERDGNTMQATALVNEAYLRLVDVKNVQWQDRAHFFAISANIMRRILVDRARAKDMDKRGNAASMSTSTTHQNSPRILRTRVLSQSMMRCSNSNASIPARLKLWN